MNIQSDKQLEHKIIATVTKYGLVIYFFYWLCTNTAELVKTLIS